MKHSLRKYRKEESNREKRSLLRKLFSFLIYALLHITNTFFLHLQYANKSPEMCRFLLENGADADRVAPPVSCNHTRMTTPLEQSLNYFEAEAEELHRAVQCLELLLEAGSDPTWQPGWQMTVPAAILSSGVPVRSALLFTMCYFLYRFKF